MGSPTRRRPGVPSTAPPPSFSPAMLRILAANAIIVGLGYSLGPVTWYSSKTLVVITEFGLPFAVWGVVSIISGVLVLFDRWIGHALCALLYTVWGCAILSTVLTGTLIAWGSPWYALTLAAIHTLGLWRQRAAKVTVR